MDTNGEVVRGCKEQLTVRSLCQRIKHSLFSLRLGRRELSGAIVFLKSKCTNRLTPKTGLELRQPVLAMKIPNQEPPAFQRKPV